MKLNIELYRNAAIFYFTDLKNRLKGIFRWSLEKAFMKKKYEKVHKRRFTGKLGRVGRFIERHFIAALIYKKIIDMENS